jgi:hypothetical protein
LEQDLSISLEGFNTEDDANNVGHTTQTVIKVLEEQYNLNISKLRKVIVSPDFPSALQRITSEYQHRLQSTYTNNDQARAIGKVISRIGKNKQQDEHALVLSFDFYGEWFLEDGSVSINESNIRPVLHRLHHELVHIHEKNTLIDLDQNKSIGNYDDALLMLATSAWSEYLANFESTPSAPDELVIETLETLEKVINQVPSEINSFVSKRKSDLIPLEEMHFAVKNRIKLIVNMYAYSHGYIHGMNINVQEQFSSLYVLLSESKLSKQFFALGESLLALKVVYEDEKLKEYDAFDEVTNAIESIYSTFGVMLERITGEDGADLYIHIS